MKNIALIIFFQFLCVGNAFSQGESDINSSADYKNCVKEFYKLFFRETVSIGTLDKVYARANVDYEANAIICDSLKLVNDRETNIRVVSSLNDSSRSFIMKFIKRYYFNDLTQGCSLSQITALIDSSKTYNQGNWEMDFLEIDFPNGRTLHFSLNPDKPVSIIGIYLSNADLLEEKFCPGYQEKLQFPGTINDPDGYVNIREKASVKSRIVGKFVENEIFYYVPDSADNWWQVRRPNDNSFVGYVHKSRIMNYTALPLYLKKKVQNGLN